MEAPLTPLAFARRTRKLYPDREAVVDGALRLTYEGFLSRCDRWSGALQRLGVGRGDRVVYISPNTHMHLESFYAVPQTGAVLVPINFRLTANDFEYIINHCGAVAVCVHGDQLDAVNTIRTKLPHVHHFVSLEGTRDGWLDYEQLLTAETGSFEPAPIDERGLLTINYTSGTTARAVRRSFQADRSPADSKGAAIRMAMIEARASVSLDSYDLSRLSPTAIRMLQQVAGVVLRWLGRDVLVVRARDTRRSRRWPGNRLCQQHGRWSAS